MGIRFVCGTSKQGEINDEQEVTANAFVVAGIDDLAKFRIVQLLCESPETSANAMMCAEQLGLRPVERTTGILEELVEHHILEKNGVDGPPEYKLTADKGMRNRLARLFAMAKNSILQANILARLATRSLERVKPPKRKKKHRPRRVVGSTNATPSKLTLGSPVPVLAEARPSIRSL